MNYDKYNQIPSINQLKVHQKPRCNQLLLSIYQSKTTMKFWKDIKITWQLPTYELFKYFRDYRQNTSGASLYFGFLGPCLKKKVTFTNLKVARNREQIASLKTHLFCKKFCIFFQYFEWNINALNSFLRTQSFTSLSIVFLSTWEKWRLEKHCEKRGMILMLRWLLYFITACEAGRPDNLLCRLSSLWYVLEFQDFFKYMRKIV